MSGQNISSYATFWVTIMIEFDQLKRETARCGQQRDGFCFRSLYRKGGGYE